MNWLLSIQKKNKITRPNNNQGGISDTNETAIDLKNF